MTTWLYVCIYVANFVSTYFEKFELKPYFVENICILHFQCLYSTEKGPAKTILALKKRI